MLDYDLAELDEVETRVLNQAVKCNPERFPGKFNLSIKQRQVEIFDSKNYDSKTETRGGTQKLSYAFSEHGITI